MRKAQKVNSFKLRITSSQAFVLLIINPFSTMLTIIAAVSAKMFAAMRTLKEKQITHNSRALCKNAKRQKEDIDITQQNQDKTAYKQTINQFYSILWFHFMHLHCYAERCLAALLLF